MSWKRLLLALILYLTVVAVILYTRPAMMFEPSGEPKRWGLGASQGEGASVFSPMILFPIFAMVSYFFASWLDLVTVNRKVPEWNMRLE